MQALVEESVGFVFGQRVGVKTAILLYASLLFQLSEVLPFSFSSCGRRGDIFIARVEALVFTVGF